MPLRLVGHRTNQTIRDGEGQWPCSEAPIMTTRRPRHIYSTFHVEALEIAQRLTQGERRWLMDHANGPRPLIRVEDALIRDKATTKRIIERPRSLRPQFTFLTDFGREVLIIVLQKEIERLVAAGCADVEAEPVVTAPVGIDPLLHMLQTVKA